MEGSIDKKWWEGVHRQGLEKIYELLFLDFGELSF